MARTSERSLLAPVVGGLALIAALVIATSEQRLERRLEGHAVVPGKGRRPAASADGDERRPRRVVRRHLRPRPAHEAGADDAEPDGHVVAAAWSPASGCRSKKSIPAVRQSSMNS